MLENEHRKQKIANALSVLEVVVRNRAAMGMLDVHKVAEDFCAGFLTRLYGKKFINLNNVYPNNSAIDLANEETRTSYQVTSVVKKAKVQSTLNQFVKDGWHKKYDRVRVLMLAQPQGSYKGLKIDPPHIFSPKDDIVGLTSLGAIAAKSDDKLHPLAEFIDAQMPTLTAFLAQWKVNDLDALGEYRKKFDRDALHHRMQVEGSMQNFGKALLDLSSLIQDGKIDGKAVAKARGDFDDPQMVIGLDELYGSLSRLLAIFNEHVNTGEIDPKGRGYNFNRVDTADKFNQHKQAVLDSLNKVLIYGGLRPLRGVDQ